jgi:hypothetical protein
MKNCLLCFILTSIFLMSGCTTTSTGRTVAGKPESVLWWKSTTLSEQKKYLHQFNAETLCSVYHSDSYMGNMTITSGFGQMTAKQRAVYASVLSEKGFNTDCTQLKQTVDKKKPQTDSQQLSRQEQPPSKPAINQNKRPKPTQSPKFFAFDPAKVNFFYCTENDGMFGGAFGGDSRCAQVLGSSCDRTYPKKHGDPLSHANNLTCRIKSGDGEFANSDEWKFGRSFLLQQRAQYLMAHQALASFEEADAKAALSRANMEIWHRDFMNVQRQRGLNMMLLGNCFATRGIQNCLGASANYQRTPEGFLTSSTNVGLNRACAYDQLGSRHVVTVASSQLCPLSLSEARQSLAKPSSGMAVLKQSFVSGTNRICIYKDGISGFVHTVGAAEICPMRP